jgi:hypothetical protein
MKKIIILLIVASKICLGQDTGIINKTRMSAVKIIGYSNNSHIISSAKNKAGYSITDIPLELGTGVIFDNKVVVTCYHIIHDIETHVSSNLDKHMTLDHIVCVTDKNDTLSLREADGLLSDIDIVILVVDSTLADFYTYRKTFKQIDSTIEDRHMRNVTRNPDSLVYSILSKGNTSRYIGEKVYYSGYPFGFNNMYSNTGMICSKDTSNLYIQGPINNGSSGSGVFDENGKIIGIIDFKYCDIGSDLNGYYTLLIKYLSKNKPTLYYEHSRNSKDSIVFASSILNKEMLDALTRQANSGLGAAVGTQLICKRLKKIVDFDNAMRK